MVGPVIATAQVAVELDGKKMLLEARVLGDKVGDIVDKRASAGAKKAGKNSGDEFSFSFLGRLKGSRNNFLNAVGGLFQLIENGAQKGMNRFVTTVGEGMEKAGLALTGLGKGGGPIEKLGEKLFDLGGSVGDLAGKGGIPGLVIALAAAAAALYTVFPLVGILGAALSGLTGIVTALASVLVVGLAGGLLAAAPLLAAVAAGVGAVVLAFTDLSDEQKKVFDPFKDWVKAIRGMIQEKLFPTIVENTQAFMDVLHGFLSPLLLQSAEALAGVIDYLAQALATPELQATMAILASTLPGILSSLGQALVDFTLGALGMFATLAPYAQDFADDVASAAASFNEWANSEEGRQQIKDFMAIAVPAFDSLVDLVTTLAPALFDLFTEGASTGQTFIEKITGLIDEFQHWFDQEGGRQQISDWFDQAADLAADMKPVLKAVGDLLIALNSPETRGALSGLMELLRTLINVFRTLFQMAQDAYKAVKSLVSLDISGVGANLGALVGRIPGLKAGGLVTSPMTLVGEAGRELVVPLTRPLSMVDPSVRSLSAIARGQDPGTFNSGFVSPANGASKVVNIHPGAVQVTAATDNEVQVANAVLDRLVARWK